MFVQIKCLFMKLSICSSYSYHFLNVQFKVFVQFTYYFENLNSKVKLSTTKNDHCLLKISCLIICYQRSKILKMADMSIVIYQQIRRYFENFKFKIQIRTTRNCRCLHKISSLIICYWWFEILKMTNIFVVIYHSSHHY